MGGERLGRYAILKHLASGGMADVLLGRADGIEGFERHVVVKRIKAEHAKDRRFIKLFLDEARLAGTLHHQNVVQVHDIGEDHGEYFFAMDYLHGEDLRRVLGSVAKAKTHVPLGHAIAIVTAAAAGLHYAHEKKIVHRDVSPSNILVGYDGAVTLVDFGIAKAAMRSAETRAGKLSYMSPEQIQGGSVDRRSDVYSLGVVLYELATTTRLFKGESDDVVIDAITNGRVPLPRVRRPDLPNELSSIIMCAPAVDPGRRFVSAEELRQALDQFALAANVAASSTQLASYMKKLFGERPEPWLETAQYAPRRSSTTGNWSEPPRTSSSDDLGGARGSGNRISNSRISEGRISESRISSSKITGSKPAIRETRTSMRMAWEHQGEAPAQAAGGMGLGKKLALFALPVALAVGGVVGWQLWKQHQTQPHAAAAAPAAAPSAPKPDVAAPAPAPAPAPAANAPGAVAQEAMPAVEERAAQTAAAAAGSADPNTAAKPKTGPGARPAVRGAAGTDGTGVELPVATPMTAPPSAAATPASATASPTTASPPPVSQPAPTAAPSSVTAPIAAPAAVPEPDAAPTFTELSQATVTMVASDHASQVAKCADASTLHGSVAVSFEINAAGRVTKSQLSSTIKNTKVAACILTAVRSWPFPKPPSGAAKGVYTITYQ